MNHVELPEDTQTYDVAGDSVVVDVVFALADVLDCSPDEVEPLYDSIDCDALRRIVNSSSFKFINFEHQGYNVVILGDGTVAVYDEDEYH